MIVDEVEYRGVTYRRYPHSPHLFQRNYFRGKRAGAWGYLHRHIWEDHHGPIPKGFHIHHRDGDALNNTVENLGCVSHRDHLQAHWTPERREAMRDRAADIRPLAREWHLSTIGRAWHQRHGKRTWAQREPKSCVCKQCGTVYETLAIGGSIYCSPACRAAARRAGGVDDIQLECVICGGPYRANKYAPRKTCSARCSAHLRSQVSRERAAAKAARS